ncbi:hypothetical protein SAMN04489712_11386 [Thermomonospora echinospora]|uniref:MAPEG family protein n=1 Tax=Thermomonospora echinospora TaxID=1992 RepID=A0A1H6D5W7_9ACTN|nr:hypothetical protein [Thermomonospora echinospora]SEG80464.1 hypothetical protein SAMN04489712_11386 [Thermomonospora echinospora]
MLFSPGWRASTRQGGVLALFTAGLLLGGVLSASVVWLLSGLSEPIPADGRWAAALAVAVLGLLREFGVLPLRLPQNARQIPQDVLQRRPRLGTLQFGFELGTGVRTYVTSAVPYVAALGLLLVHPSPAMAAATGLGFGAGRALTAAFHLWSRDEDWNARASTRMPWLPRLAAVAVLAALLLLSPWYGG